MSMAQSLKFSQTKCRKIVGVLASLAQSQEGREERKNEESEKTKGNEGERGTGGFRDTYLGIQIVSRPGGPRAEMGSAGVWAPL